MRFAIAKVVRTVCSLQPVPGTALFKMRLLADLYSRMIFSFRHAITSSQLMIPCSTCDNWSYWTLA